MTTFKIQIDRKVFDIEQQFITGLELKLKAGVPNHYGVWLIGLNSQGDKEVSDNEQVDLNQPNRNNFLTGSKQITEG